MRLRCGPLILDNYDMNMYQNVILSSQPIYLEGDDVIYHGEWLSCGIRSGLGLQIWRDGSIYEGEFFSGKPHGRGRLIHATH
jgi:hypothetical protein